MMGNKGGGHNLQCGHRHNTGNQHRLNARLVAIQRRVPLMAEVVSSSPLCQVNRTTRRHSKSEHVDHVRFQEICGVTWGQR